MHFLFTSSNNLITFFIQLSKLFSKLTARHLVFFGGDKEIRTLDPLLAKQVL